MKRQLIFCFTILSLIACNTVKDPESFQRDAEQMADDKCKMIWVNTKIGILEKQMSDLEYAFETQRMTEDVMKEMTHKKYKLRDQITYYNEQKKGYQQNDQEEEADLKSVKYKNPELWNRLVQQAEQIVKSKKCKPTE